LSFQRSLDVCLIFIGTNLNGINILRSKLEKKNKRYSNFQPFQKQETSFGVSSCFGLRVSTNFQRMIHFRLKQPNGEKYLTF
jgi:hypothetical protein